MDADNEKHEVPDRASDLVQVSVGSTKEQETLKEPPDGGRAWLVLVGCFCGLFCTQGYNYAWGVFLAYYNEHVYVNQMTPLSWIGSLWLALANIVGPFYGYLSRKVGYGWMLAAAMVCCTAGMMLASISHEIWHLYLTQGVLAGVGASLVWFPCISAPQQWFSERRGLSVGIAISGSGFGGLVISNIVQAAISAVGYRWALRILGFINFVLISIAAIFVRPLNKPTGKAPPIISLKPFKNWQFDVLFLIQFITNFAFNIPSSFLPSYASYLGLDPWIGSNMSAILSALMIVGKISSGFLSDYIGRANMTFICVFMTGFWCLFLWLNATNSASVWAFAALFGLFGGGYMTMIPALLAQVVGPEEIEQANGMLFFAWFFGGLFGSPISSALIDENGPDGPKYSDAIIFGGTLMVFTGLLALGLRIYRGGWNPLRKV